MRETVDISLSGPVRSVDVIRPDAAATDPDGTGQPQPDGGAEAAALRAQQAVEQELAAVRQAREALEKGLGELAKLRTEIIHEAEEQLLELSLEIARKVMMQEIAAERYEIETIVKEVMKHAPSRRAVTVRLHPDDLAHCKLADPENASQPDGQLQFVPDTTVKRAECILETSEGIVHSEIDSHLQEIGEALKSTEQADGRR